MCKDTQQRCIISKCVFNGHSIKIKQDHISKVVCVCVSTFKMHFYLGFISSWLPEAFLQIQFNTECSEVDSFS